MSRGVGAFRASWRGGLLACAALLACAQPLLAAPAPLPPLLLNETSNEADWVPVVLMDAGRQDQLATDGVLLGFLQLSTVPQRWSAPERRRVQLQGQVPVIDRLSLKGMLAGSEFKPCLGLIEQSELAPLRPDLCERLAAQDGDSRSLALGALLDLDSGWIGVSFTRSEGSDLDLAGPVFARSPLPAVFSNQRQRPALDASPLPARHESTGVDLQTVLEIDNESRIGIGLALARAQLQGAAGMAPTTVDQGALTFTLEQGNLGAVLGTRVMDFPGLSDFLPWAGLDLGVSWRLPWQGVISFGAQNLLRHGEAPRKGFDPVLDEGAEAFERMPYVRYHQDL